MIDVFLDSNILYLDPLMEKGYNKILFEKINRIGGRIFICDVVYKETINNYRKKLYEIKIESDKLKSKIEKLNIKADIMKPIDIEMKINEIEERLQEYINVGKIIKLQTNNDILPEVIDRAIKRKKPFTEGKQEFRDCVIWLTYAQKVEREGEENCIFITKNVSDFCNKQGQLHSDLLEDTKKIRFHSDSYQFLQNESELISIIEKDKVRSEFKDYTIDKSRFENQLIFNSIYECIYNYLIGLSESEINEKFRPIYLDYIDLESIDINYIIKKSNDVNIDELFITELGDIEIEAVINLKVYDNEQDFSIGETSIVLQTSYLAEVKIENIDTSKVEKDISRIQLENIEIKSIDEDIFVEYYSEEESNARAEMMDALENYYMH